MTLNVFIAKKDITMIRFCNYVKHWILWIIMTTIVVLILKDLKKDVWHVHININ